MLMPDTMTVSVLSCIGIDRYAIVLCVYYNIYNIIIYIPKNKLTNKNIY